MTGWSKLDVESSESEGRQEVVSGLCAALLFCSM